MLMKKMFLVATLLPLMATTAQAQDDRVERLEVTGSHIKRIDVEGPSPIQMLDREFLDNSGYNSVSDVLRDITASAFGGARESAGSNAAGVATVNLRGLGADRTLVLLDGKRLPTDPISGAVDLNLIPMGAVQRIDILKDGASATYGSDALGGVVNIVTRKDFVGSEVSIRSSINKDEGGERTDASLLHGYANNKFRIIGVANFRTNKEIKSKDRKWSEEGYSTFAVPANRTPVTLDGDGNITGSTGPMEPSPSCPADMLQNGLCTFKYTEYSDEVPSIDQISVMLQAEYRISPDITAYARVIGNQNKVKWQYAPNAASYIDSTTVLGTNYLVRDRMLELGPRISDGETKSFGIQTGLKGYMFDTWSWDITYDYNNLKRDVKNPGGYALNDRLTTLIQSGAYNPYAVFGSRIAAGQVNFSTCLVDQLTQLSEQCSQVKITQTKSINRV
jgi:iron complex outermembrane receptor protein